MNKTTKTILTLAVVAGVLYFVFKKPKPTATTTTTEGNK
jgi:hypothetical protein